MMGLKDLLLAALKAEMESKAFYEGLSGRVKNFLLKDRLNFLASEEEKHRLYFYSLLEEKFPEEEIVPPPYTPVPLPSLELPNEEVPLSEILWQAMQAEKAAEEFYTQLAEQFAPESRERKMLIYIAAMERGHYRLLDQEREVALRFEESNFTWPMIHLGP